MSNPVIAVEFGSPLEEVWELLQRHNIRGMPVVDRGKNLLGMVTVSDFVRHAEHFDHPTLAERLAHLRRPTPSLESNKPEVAGQIMTAPVISVGVEVPVSEAVSVFSRHKIHHLPVVDEKGKVRGMLTREDVMTARARKPSGHEEEQQR
jgi:CBS domain-containing membrane protein